jgi:hypothetical protein
MSGQAMDEIPISKFNTEYLAILKQLRKTERSIFVTRFGQPIAEVRAVPRRRIGKRRLGTLSDSMVIHGDIHNLMSSLDDWEAARESSESDPRDKKTQS